MLYIEKNKFAALQGEMQDSKLDELLNDLPIGARQQNAPPGRAPTEPANLHALVVKLAHKLATNQKETMERLLKGNYVSHLAHTTQCLWVGNARCWLYFS